MARPAQVLITSLVPGIGSMDVNYTNPSVADTDNLYFGYREFGTTTWTWLDIAVGNTNFEYFDLEPDTTYEFALKAVSSTDGAGPMSNVLRATTLDTAFGTLQVEWDDTGLDGDGVGNQLNSISNTGAAGSNYDMDTLFGTTTQLTEQVRNGRRVWQSGGASPNAIKTSPTPPTPSIAQTCTIYFACTIFFIDGVDRWVLRGGFGSVELRVSNTGWRLSSSGSGVSSVGSGVADGRVYVVECQINNNSSKLRVIDSNGNDSGEQNASLAFSGNIDVEVLTWDVSQTSNQDIPMQVYGVYVYSGLGDADSRTAERNRLMQRAKESEPNIVTPSFPPEPVYNNSLSIGCRISL